MRRLTGMSFFADGPVRVGHLQLADLTVLTGANDSGKNRVLQVIREALGGELLYDEAYVFALASRDELVPLLEDPDDLNRHCGCVGRGSEFLPRHNCELVAIAAGAPTATSVLGLAGFAHRRGGGVTGG